MYLVQNSQNCFLNTHFHVIIFKLFSFLQVSKQKFSIHFFLIDANYAAPVVCFLSSQLNTFLCPHLPHTSVFTHMCVHFAQIFYEWSKLRIQKRRNAWLLKCNNFQLVCLFNAAPPNVLPQEHTCSAGAWRQPCCYVPLPSYQSCFDSHSIIYWGV